MNEFILAWVLMVFDGSHSALTYSPPVKTLEDCQRMQSYVDEYRKNWGGSKCIQINVLKKASEK